MDSCCSFHTTPSKNYFITYQCTDSRKVELGNNVKCNVSSVSNVKIIMHDNIVRRLTTMRYIGAEKPDFLEYLGSARCRYTLEGEIMKVIQGVLVMMRGIKHIGLFEL